MKKTLNNSPILYCLLISTLLCFVSITVCAGLDNGDNSHSAVSTAKQFSKALETGDVNTVKNLLADDVLIYESGGVESSLAEYSRHHLNADIKFLSAMEKEFISQNSFEKGELAVVTTVSALKGLYGNKAMNITSTETLVLQRTDQHWKIVHIHWSSK
jgi:ketosteroid isomerase-like protein